MGHPRPRCARSASALVALVLLGVAACSAGTDGAAPEATDRGSTGASSGSPRLDQIQVLGTHNSYHLAPDPALLDTLGAFLGPDEAEGFDYTHAPLGEQLDAGVRQIELDVFVDDPAGGRYATPVLFPALGLDPVDPALREPGLKVFHVQEVDLRSTCPTLTRCLEHVAAWSDAHPDHLPVTIQIEPKDDGVADPGGEFVTPLPWTGDAFDRLEEEIAAVFPPSRVLTPAEVRGEAATLADAVRDGGWPTVDAARGRVLFLLDDGGEARDAYRAARPDLGDRTVFVDVPASDPDAAVMVRNDPVAEGDDIRALVTAGFLVRTRADADTAEARSGDTTRRDAALAGGAQFVTTDYVRPDERFGTGYRVRLPGDGPARCNPVTAPPDCDDADLTG